MLAHYIPTSNFCLVNCIQLWIAHCNSNMQLLMTPLHLDLQFAHSRLDSNMYLLWIPLHFIMQLSASPLHQDTHSQMFTSYWLVKTIQLHPAIISPSRSNIHSCWLMVFKLVFLSDNRTHSRTYRFLLCWAGGCNYTTFVLVGTLSVPLHPGGKRQQKPTVRFSYEVCLKHWLTHWAS